MSKLARKSQIAEAEASLKALWLTHQQLLAARPSEERFAIYASNACSEGAFAQYMQIVHCL